MTFHNQLRSTFLLGSVIFLGSGIFALAAYDFRRTGYVVTSEVLSIVTLIVLVLALLTLIAGLVGRSLHRWVWFNVISRSERKVFGRTAAERLLQSPASPILRVWLHIDPEGRDRDGLV